MQKEVVLHFMNHVMHQHINMFQHVVGTYMALLVIPLSSLPFQIMQCLPLFLHLRMLLNNLFSFLLKISMGMHIALGGMWGGGIDKFTETA